MPTTPRYSLLLFKKTQAVKTDMTTRDTTIIGIRLCPEPVETYQGLKAGDQTLGNIMIVKQAPLRR
jgi:hypothetical protein